MGNRNSNETKKGYFNLINQNMRTALHTNYYSKQNQFISIIKIMSVSTSNFESGK